MKHNIVVVSEPDSKKLTVEVAVDGKPVTLKLREGYFRAGLHKGRRLLDVRVSEDGYLEWYRPDSFTGDAAAEFLLGLGKEVKA